MRSLSFPHTNVGNVGLGDVQKAGVKGRPAGAVRNSRTWDSWVPTTGTSDFTGNEGDSPSAAVKLTPFLLNSLLHLALD